MGRLTSPWNIATTCRVHCSNTSIAGMKGCEGLYQGGVAPRTGPGPESAHMVWICQPGQSSNTKSIGTGDNDNGAPPFYLPYGTSTGFWEWLQPRDVEQWTENTVKCVVIQLLKEMSQIRLAALCPLSQPLISNIANAKVGVKIGHEKCSEFGRWYIHFRETLGSSGEYQGPEGRLTFHSTQELPLLRQWYAADKNPSRATLQTYTEILNSLPIRRERVKVTVKKLRNWWKNEGQRQRRGPSTGRRGRPRKFKPAPDHPSVTSST